jgi:hypothetical protein
VSRSVIGGPAYLECVDFSDFHVRTSCRFMMIDPEK